MTAQYSTKAPGNGFKADEGHSCRANRVCAHCGAPLVGRRPQTRFCCPTCRAAAFDQRHNRKAHTKVGEL